MHQESANKLNAGDGMFFPPAFFPVIFHIVGNGILIHTDNTMVTDGNPVGILSKVVNNGLCTVKGFLAVRNPVLVITKVQKFLESIMITILFAASVELKFLSSQRDLSSAMYLPRNSFDITFTGRKNSSPLSSH